MQTMKIRLTLALVKELHRVGRDGKQVSDIFVSGKDLCKVSTIIIDASNGPTPLMWSVNDRRSSSLMLCVELDPAVPLTAIRPLFVSSLGYQLPAPTQIVMF
jgi:hypothetical protein